MKRSVHYRVYSGKVSKAAKPFYYKYSNTNGIKIIVSKRGFSIEADRTVKKDVANLLQDNLFRDAIKKAGMIQLILYGAVLEADLYAEIDGVVSCVHKKENGKLVYFMCGDKLQSLMPQNWTDGAIQRVLSSKKSKADRLDAVLDALLISKSKKYVSEKFIFLWMAINGLYGFAAEKADSSASANAQKWLNKEYGKIKFFSMLLGYPYCARADKQSKECSILKLKIILSKVRKEDIDPLIIAAKNKDTQNDTVQEIITSFEAAGIKAETMHPYSVLLLYVPYKIRCKYFHSENPMPLACFEEEYPLPVLRILNRAMEKFLDENLYKWFDERIFNSEIIPRISLIAEKCECDKNGYLKSCVINGEVLA